MTVPVRAPMLATLGTFGLFAVLFAAGCSSPGTEARTTLVNVQPTSYVVRDPVPTTTTLPPIPTAPPEGGQTDPNEQEYTVQGGDSLFRIASIHDITTDELIAINGWPEGAAHVFQAGEIVRIPPGSKVPDSGGEETGGEDTGGEGSASEPEDTEPVGVACTYTIVAGDAPARVAEDHGVTFDELQAANPTMDFRTTFVVGDEINIPLNGSCE